MKGFFEFIRKQGVIGLAIAFVLGAAVVKVITALVDDIINPLLGFILGAAKNLSDAYVQIGGAKLMWGDFVNNLINFVVIALVVYFIFFKLLKLDRFDITEKKKE